MVGGESGADKCFFCLVSIVLPFSNRGNCCEWGLSERLRLRVKIRFLMARFLSKKRIPESLNRLLKTMTVLFCVSFQKKHDKMLRILYVLRTFATQKENYGSVL